MRIIPVSAAVLAILAAGCSSSGPDRVPVRGKVIGGAIALSAGIGVCDINPGITKLVIIRGGKTLALIPLHKDAKASKKFGGVATIYTFSASVPGGAGSYLVALDSPGNIGVRASASKLGHLTLSC